MRAVRDGIRGWRWVFLRMFGGWDFGNYWRVLNIVIQIHLHFRKKIDSWEIN